MSRVRISYEQHALVEDSLVEGLSRGTDPWRIADIRAKRNPMADFCFMKRGGQLASLLEAPQIYEAVRGLAEDHRRLAGATEVCWR